MDSLIRKISRFIRDKDFSGEKAVLKAVSGKSVSEDIRLENYDLLKKNKNHTSAFFVDGGSASLLSSSAFALGMFRACTIKLEENDFSLYFLKDLFCAALPEKKFFVLHTSPSYEFIEGMRVHPKSSDDALDSGVPWKACSAARRLLELSIVFKVVSENKDSLIVLDGSLDGEDHEESLLEAIKSTALKNNNVVLGLSKSNSFSTNMNRPLSYALMEKKSGSWVYKFSESPSRFFSVCYAKLHEQSEFAFRIDFFPEQENAVNGALESLSSTSDDSLFQGYPFGLIEADDFARISLEEKESVLEGLASSNKEWNSVEEAASNAHKILDSAKF